MPGQRLTAKRSPVPNRIQAARGVGGKGGKPDRPAMMDGCPEMQARGFYLRNVRGVNVSGVRVLGVRGETIDADDSVRNRIVHGAQTDWKRSERSWKHSRSRWKA